MNFDRAGRCVVVAAALAYLVLPSASAAEATPQNDLLNAELWMQTAVEYRANCAGQAWAQRGAR